MFNINIVLDNMSVPNDIKTQATAHGDSKNTCLKSISKLRGGSLLPMSHHFNRTYGMYNKEDSTVTTQHYLTETPDGTDHDEDLNAPAQDRNNA